jgi:hypothetical protein
VPDGIITLSTAIGTPAGLQLVEAFQSVLEAPVQVFWANPLKVAISRNERINGNDVFMSVVISGL